MRERFTYIAEDDNLNRGKIEKYMRMSFQELEIAIENEQKRWDSLTEKEQEKECYNA